MAQVDDTVFVMSAILVPEQYAVDIMPGAIWKQTGDAERRLRQASVLVRQFASPSVSFRYVRVQARDHASAIITGARHYDAQLILFASNSRWFDRLTTHYGVISHVARSTVCGVRVIPVSALPRQQDSPVPFIPSIRGTHLPSHGA